MFEKSLCYMHEFDDKHMGAKSNNLKILREKMDSGIKLPESACIPFQVLEYSLSLEPAVKQHLQDLIAKITSVKSVKKMNKILHQCK